MKFIPHDYQKFATQFVLEHPYCGLIQEARAIRELCTAMRRTKHRN